MKKLFVFSFLLAFISGNAVAQYYYKDILSNQQLIATMKLYRDNRVRMIKIKSFEDDGGPSEDFFCEKKISKDFKKTELFTKSNISSSSLMTSVFDDAGRLVSTNDSSDISVTRSFYTYDNKNNIISILSSVKSHDDDFANEVTEEHIYDYSGQDLPVKMTKVKNRLDSTIIFFSNDEHNNLSIEKDSKSGGKYYYYYDVKNRLSDIVQANDLRANLHPNYIFDYNAGNQVTQMTVTEEGGNDYFVWKYTYDNGLRIREKCYTKERKLMGSIEYEYK